MPEAKRIICLSNAFDQNYHDARGEEIDRCLGTTKRRKLYEALEQATGRKLILLSSPPKAARRRRGAWLPAMETKYFNQQQLFCCNWDFPKLRIPCSWIFYTRHVIKQARSGDLVIIDNYEFIYVFAAWFLKAFKDVKFLLDYEDGKHLIDKSIARVLSGMAELFGRPLIRAAILAHPGLGRRLSPQVPTVLVPGLICRRAAPSPKPLDDTLNVLYSGSLDRTRGVNLLLEALPLLPPSGWHLHISGQGILENEVGQAQKQWPEKVTFHGPLSDAAYAELLAKCHIGLNCQRDSDPISAVTFPSKIFTYLSAEMLVVSSRASEVPDICGEACVYYDAETPQSLAQAITKALSSYADSSLFIAQQSIAEKYSIVGTVQRLRGWLASAQLP